MTIPPLTDPVLNTLICLRVKRKMSYNAIAVEMNHRGIPSEKNGIWQGHAAKARLDRAGIK